MRATRVFGFVASVFITATAFANESSPAEAAFDAGVSLMKAGRFAEACPKIEESQRLEPRAGVLFTLAECRYYEGKLAEARARYREYLTLYESMSESEQRAQRGRERVAKARREELDLRVERAAPARAATLSPQALPLAPRHHRARPVRSRSAPPEDRKNTQSDRSVAYAALGVGALGIAVGATTGIWVLSKKNGIAQRCGVGGDEHACSAEGKAQADSAQKLALASSIGFAVGIAGLGTGGVLLVRGANDHEGAGASVALSGRF